MFFATLIALFSTSAFANSYYFFNDDNTAQQLKSCGLSVSKDFVQSIHLTSKQLNCLNSSQDNGHKSLNGLEKDFPISIEKNDSPITSDQRSYFLAKKEFGIPDFLKKNPSFDGRGVTVGVIDDGISPNQSGFKVTTTNKRNTSIGLTG